LRACSSCSHILVEEQASFLDVAAEEGGRDKGCAHHLGGCEANLPVVAVLDADVLHAIPVCDCLMWIALEGAIRPHWTDTIHEEWIASLLARRRDLSRAALERRRRAMEVALPGARVRRDLRRVHALELPDARDRHVVAAAVAARATHIITYNLRDFPGRALEPYGCAAVHPDDVLYTLLRTARADTLRAVRSQRTNLGNPPIGAERLLSTFRGHGLVRFADALAPFAAEI
jgi:hypothetical protein